MIRAALITSALALAVTTDALAPTAVSAQNQMPADRFANAVAACFKALEADTPAKGRIALEAIGWKFHQSTPLGGLYGRAGGSIDLKLETVFQKRICTILGNRDPATSLADLAASIQVELDKTQPGRVRREEDAANVTLVADGKYRAVMTPW